MRVLILGGEGMLGHQLLIELSKRHDVTVTLRQDPEAYQGHWLFSPKNSITSVNVTDINRLRQAIQTSRPQAVVNAIGLVKQGNDSGDVIRNLEVNSLLPHRLAELCAEASARLVHVSTDCVFSGKRGAYMENDTADATDLYGRTKYLGEVTGSGCLTLRTSIIGLELKRRKSLVEWFLAARGEISGYTQAIYSGLTTAEFARVVLLLLEDFPALNGLFHVVSEPISKHDILVLLARNLRRSDVTIRPDASFVCDRSMVGDKFNRATGYKSPSWPVLLAELSQQIQQRPL
jgi:dTDP-4-dehydrorhamnose reductase